MFTLLSGEWMMILNLSAPEGHSINDGIDRGLLSVAYTSVDDVIRSVRAWEGALIEKADVKASIPEHSRPT